MGGEKTTAGRESPQGMKFTTRTRSYGDQSVRLLERAWIDELVRRRSTARRDTPSLYLFVITLPSASMHGPRREVLGRDQLQRPFHCRLFSFSTISCDLGVHLRERLVARLWPRHVRLVADELLVLVRVGALRWIGFWGAGGGGASEWGDARRGSIGSPRGRRATGRIGRSTTFVRLRRGDEAMDVKK